MVELGMLTATASHDKRERCAIRSPICLPSLAETYDRYRLDANNRVRTDAELVEYVEDQWEKQLNQRDHLWFGTRFCPGSQRQKSPVQFWFYDGFFLTDKSETSYWAPANDKNRILWTSRLKWYQAKGYNTYGTGSVTHLIEHIGHIWKLSTPWNDPPNSDGAIYFEGYGRRED